MTCIECGRQNEYKYEDETSQSLKKRLCSWLPSSSQVGSFFNFVSLAGIVYALKLLRDERSSIDDMEVLINAIYNGAALESLNASLGDVLLNTSQALVDSDMVSTNSTVLNNITV